MHAEYATAEGEFVARPARGEPPVDDGLPPLPHAVKVRTAVATMATTVRLPRRRGSRGRLKARTLSNI
jgi:hypothetical protein